MYYCITIYMLEKWPISLSYHHIIFGLGGHVFCLLAEEHCTRWRGKKKSKKRIPSSATSSCTFISQIREQMSGLNLHVFTQFLALKETSFSPIKILYNILFLFLFTFILCNFLVRTLKNLQKKLD